MVQRPHPNYTALSQGVKLYTDALRRLVQERLMATFGNKWWETGVLAVLSSQQRNNLKRELQQHPDKRRIDYLDAQHLERVIISHFSQVFGSVLGDFDQMQAWLKQASLARSGHVAHAPSGDLAADETGHFLWAMAQVLARAKLPEAEAVEALRRDVLGLASESAAAPPAVPQVIVSHPAASAPLGALPYWWQVCEPHDAFQHPARVDESSFTATLGGVHAGAARAEYADPAVFLGHTYFTENLKQTIYDVASRLRGEAGPAVTEMQTPFGGGKTHALLTLYHLIKQPEKALAVPGVREALGDLRLPRTPRVVVFDGFEWGTEPVMKANGATVSTLWGELAFQVDPLLYHQLVSESDSRGEAPGNAVYRQLLQAAAPCLILIDELVGYLVKLKFSNARRTQNLYRQTVQFFQELLQEVGNVRGVCVLLSLPKSRREFGGIDPGELQQQLAVLDELQPRADRVVAKRTPVNDDEIYTLMSKRLFKRVDRQAAEQVARAYRALYERAPNDYDPAVLSPDYLQHQIHAYPLHPELVDVLYKKWSTASDFPRTRAVLQLLASVVADQWVHRREAFTIQSAHVNLERERLRTRIVSAAGAGGGYDAVVAADIIGGDAHADLLDQRRGGDYARFQITRGIATTLLMHSFGGALHTGAAPADLRLGTVAPNLGPEYVSEVLDGVEQSLWYVHREGERLRFQTRANIYRVIAQTAEGQAPTIVTERLQAALGEVVGDAPGFRVLPWAPTNGAIPNRPDLTIAVLQPRYAVWQDNGGPVLGREPIDQLWDRHGGGLREWRNALILIAPDRDLWDSAERAMRQVMAYETTIASAKRGRLDVSAPELKDLEARFLREQDGLRTSLVTAYRWVFYPDDMGLSVLALPVPATSKDTILRRAVDRLSNQDYGQPKILTKMGAVYFNSKIVPRVWHKDSKPLDLAELSRRFAQWTYLPILPDRERTLRACIVEGLKLKLWAVAIGDNASLQYQKLIELPEALDDSLTLFDGSASLVRGELLELVRDDLRKPAGAAPPPTEAPPTPGPAPRDAAPGGVVKESRPPVIAPPKRFRRVRLRVDTLPVAKTSNLQMYLFKVLQSQDPGATVGLSIEVSSDAGIPEEALEKRIVEGLEQLNIMVTWEPA